MRQSKHLNLSVNLTVDHREWESPQRDLTNIWRAHDLESAWSAAGTLNGAQRRLVISPTKASAVIFVVSDLLLVFQRRIWMEPVIHFNRA